MEHHARHGQQTFISYESMFYHCDIYVTSCYCTQLH